jgi:hypothetical protein
LNQRRRKPTDLQSVPFNHSGTPPAEGAGYSQNPSGVNLLAPLRNRNVERRFVVAAETVKVSSVVPPP